MKLEDYGKASLSDKNKVHVMMSLINQETEKATELGSQIAMDARESCQAFTMTGPELSAHRTFEFTKLEDGGISKQYTMQKNLVSVQDADDEYETKVGEGSTFKCSIDYTLKGDELTRISELDYSKFNDKEVLKRFDSGTTMPDDTKQYCDQRLLKLVDSFPDGFKVKGDCAMRMSMNLTPSENG